MTQSTKEQKQWFWEQCGFTEKGTGFVWPDGRFDKAPPRDLNNLFKYAVPRLIEAIGLEDTWELLENWLVDVLFNHRAPVDSLFELVYKAFGGKE